MGPHLEAALLGLLAGLMIPFGAAFARIERLRPRWLEEEFRHSVMAFGGGVLIAPGGIPLLMLHDIAPKVPLENRIAPSMSAVGGFAFGLMAEMLVR